MTLTPKEKVIGQKAGICDGAASTSALVFYSYRLFTGCWTSISINNQEILNEI